VVGGAGLEPATPGV